MIAVATEEILPACGGLGLIDDSIRACLAPRQMVHDQVDLVVSKPQALQPRSPSCGPPAVLDLAARSPSSRRLDCHLSDALQSPISGNTCARSDKLFKGRAARGLRFAVRTALRGGRDEILPHAHEIASEWNFPKDGKLWLGDPSPERLAPLMRK